MWVPLNWAKFLEFFLYLLILEIQGRGDGILYILSDVVLHRMSITNSNLWDGVLHQVQFLWDGILHILSDVVLHRV